MRMLSRHLVGSYLSYYVAILVVSLLVIAVIEMMVKFDDIIEYGNGFGGAAGYLFLRLPSYYLPFLIPVGSFAAAFLCLGLPARALEIVAAKTGGISPRRLALPVLVTASILSVVAFVVNETVVRETSNEFNRLKHGGGDELFQSRGAFWYHSGYMLFSVGEADRDQKTLSEVTVYERDRDGRLLRSIQAAKAHIEADRRWRLEHAVFREFDVNDPTAAPHTEIREQAWLDLGRGGDLALLDADPRSLSLPRLLDYIEAREEGGRDVARCRALLNERLADPLTVLVFALLAVPIGLAVEHSRSLASAALRGIVVLAAYYAVQSTSAVLGSGGVSAAAVAPWLVLAIFAAYGAWRFRHIAA